jgi:hypothetical protein
MTTEAPKPRGTKFPGFPSLPKLPDPSAPLDAILNGLHDLQDQGTRAIEAADQLTKTAAEGASALQQTAKTRLKAPPFPGKKPPL